MESLLRGVLSASISAQGYDVDQQVASTLRLAERDPNYVTVVADTDSLVLGLIIGYVDLDASSAFIRWIAVGLDVRRQGIGSRLVAKFEDATRAALVKGYVNLEDPVAVAFWEARGWRRLHPPPRRVMMGRQL
jgi:GNAT superfamily N-acetyltransferase